MAWHVYSGSIRTQIDTDTTRQRPGLLCRLRRLQLSVALAAVGTGPAAEGGRMKGKRDSFLLGVDEPPCARKEQEGGGYLRATTHVRTVFSREGREGGVDG